MNNPNEPPYPPGQPYSLPTESGSAGGSSTHMSPGPAGPPGGQPGAPYGQPGGAPPGGHGPFRTGQPNTMVIAAGLALCGLVAVAAWALLSSHPSSTESTDPVKPTAAEVQAEPTNSSGSNAFTPPVGQDKTGLPAVAASGTVSGATPAVYGAAGDKPSCDAPTLLAYLQADPAKAGAWAQSLDIAVADIPSFVQTLSPVLLRADTSVVVHGYLDGKFDPYPAILQAGTAVFVNPYGEPTVKCFSGDPLSRGLVVTQVAVVGRVWPGFAPGTVVVIQPTPTPVEQRVVLDLVTNQTLIRRVIHVDRFGPCRDLSSDPRFKKFRRDGVTDQKVKNTPAGRINGNELSTNTANPNPSNNLKQNHSNSVNTGQESASSAPVKPEIATSPSSTVGSNPNPNLNSTANPNSTISPNSTLNPNSTRNPNSIPGPNANTKGNHEGGTNSGQTATNNAPAKSEHGGDH